MEKGIISLDEVIYRIDELSKYKIERESEDSCKLLCICVFEVTPIGFGALEDCKAFKSSVNY